MIAIITLTRRYRKSRAADDDEFLEKYLGPGNGGFSDNIADEPAEFGHDPLAVGATAVRPIPALADAYPDRTIHYGQSNPGSVFRPYNYGIGYPPDAAHDMSTSANENTGSSAGHPFADPFNVPRIGTAPAIYQRPVVGRTQEMVATDSYYGPNSAGVGAGGMGIAH
jgi:hypothetical protein